MAPPPPAEGLAHQRAHAEGYAIPEGPSIARHDAMNQVRASRSGPPSGDSTPKPPECRPPGDQPAGPGGERGPQLTAFFTSATTRASSAAVNSFSAKAVGHMPPSSRFASCMKPNVAYLVLNFCALWKKQTTLPPLAYAGIPYQSRGVRAGALALMIAWSRSPRARSGPGIAAIFATTALSPSALSARGPGRADPFFAPFLVVLL